MIQLESLRQTADEMLSGIHAGEELKRRVLFEAQAVEKLPQVADEMLSGLTKTPALRHRILVAYERRTRTGRRMEPVRVSHITFARMAPVMSMALVLILVIGMGAFGGLSSDGVTASCRDVWVQDLPYLASVASPESGESVPNYYSVREFTAAEFQKIMRAAHAQADFSGAPETWITDPVRNGSDRVETITIGGMTVEGTEVRRLYGLRSASFTAEATAETVRFHVTGYGHGVGMSQYGANTLASEGKTWQEILHWYYTDVTIETYRPE